VGHGGASAYLGLMALFAIPADAMRPTALALNLIVAGIAAARLLRAGQFNPRLFLLFACGAMPLAFLGGMIVLPGTFYRPLVGIVLWMAALRLIWRPAFPAHAEVRPPSAAIALPAGAGLGLLAGLTGTGGGIFLSPLILLRRWELPRPTSGVAALFILVNSAAGLAGNVTALGKLPPFLPLLALAVIAGAVLGTWLGVDRLPRRRLEQALAIVLLFAGAKLILS
jgi:uncharacterized membrane protein YfcA